VWVPLSLATPPAVSTKSTTVPPPEDLSTALLVIQTQHQELDARQQKIEAHERRIEELMRKVDVLCHKLFGKKSEKVDPNQRDLAFDLALGLKTSETVEMDSGEPLPFAIATAKRRRGGIGRRPLPANIPVVEELNDVAAEEKTCAGCDVKKVEIGRESSQKLDYEPASVYNVVTITPKYACPKCHEGVVKAAAPVQAIEKGMAAEGLLSFVITSKYADHLPLHRLESILKRQGIDIDRSTMCGWVGKVAEAVSPIYDELKTQILKTDYLQTDDTSVVILDDPKGSYKGRLWVYRDSLGRQAIFDATRTHEKDGPRKFLKGFSGFLQADAYKGYDVLYRDRTVTEVACWAHGRRRFVEGRDTDRPRADAVLSLVRDLYQVERDAAQVSAEKRQAMRIERSVPLLAKIDELRRQYAKEVLPKSPIGEALRYLDNQWTALNRYVTDGRLLIDNNNAERELRHVAVGRKNWMFSGRFEGARRTAILYTLVSCCRLQDIDPFVYFRDVVLRVATHSQSRIAELTPRAWKLLFASEAARKRSLRLAALNQTS
jgi:transposase